MQSSKALHPPRESVRCTCVE